VSNSFFAKIQCQKLKPATASHAENGKGIED